MPTRKPAAVLASLLLFLACSSSVVRAAESLEVAPTWVAGGDHAPLTGLNAADQLVNWQLTAVLMSDGVSRSAGLGWFDPRRMESDYQLVSTYIGIDKPFDVKTAYTSQFLDPSIKMIEAKEP